MFQKWRFHRKREDAFVNLQERLEQLETTLKQIRDGELKHNITIDTLHIHNPVLEHLTFQLDKLDIDEVSGALNLGNNFGMRIQSRARLKHRQTAAALENDFANKANSHVPSSDDSAHHVAKRTAEQTASGFRFQF